MLISEIAIENFRSIKQQRVESISNALVLIGKNNSGKSAVLSAIRAFWGDFTPEPKDVYKGEGTIKISAKFELSESDLNDWFWNPKIGFQKIPASSQEFNAAKAETKWEDKDYSSFRNERERDLTAYSRGDISILESYYELWYNSTQKRLNIQDNSVTALYTVSPPEKPTYDLKDFSSYLPDMAFINDSRNFEDEEVGRPKTLTASIVKMIQSALPSPEGQVCNNCSERDCYNRCIYELEGKQATELSEIELEKLMNYRMNQSSEGITNLISERFQSNYQNGYQITLKSTANMDKAFSISTKIYDPILGNEIELSNVGAGIRSIYVLSLLQAYQTINSTRAMFMIEEPELYLHPELQKEMAKTLATIADTSQVVFTTHSPTLLHEFSVEDSRMVSIDKESYQTIIKCESLDAILSEIGYSSQDIILTDFIVFVEGKSDLEIIKCLLEKYYRIHLDRISIIDTQSCKNIRFYATLKFLQKTTLNQDFIIIRDADTRPRDQVKMELENTLNEQVCADFAPIADSKIYVTKYSSIEGYVFSPEILVDNDLFPSVGSVFDELRDKLTTNQNKLRDYFRKQNSLDQERINRFDAELEERISSPANNLEWIKENIKGHTYFNYVQSSRVTAAKYVESLPQ